MYFKKFQYFISLVFLLCSTWLWAEQRLDMKGTAIIGNKELPKVLYIVPWKSAESISLTTPPYSSVLDEAFKPIERYTFKRQVNYYNETYPSQQSKP